MSLYKEAFFSQPPIISKRETASSHQMMRHIAENAISAMDRVVKSPALLQEGQQDVIYQWLARFSGFKNACEQEITGLLNAIGNKNTFTKASATA